MKRKPKCIRAWAAVGKRTGKILRDWVGQYGIYNKQHDARLACPDHGIVRQVEIHVINGGKQ